MILGFLWVLSLFGDDLTEQKNHLEQQLTTTDRPGEVHLQLSEVLSNLGELKGGVTHARKGLEYLPNSAPAHHRLAVALRLKMEKKPFAWMSGKTEYLESLEKALALDESFVPAYQELAGFHLSAPRFLGAHLDKAVALGEKASQYDLKKGGRILLDAYGKKQDKQARLKVMTGLLEQFPDDVDLHLDQAITLQNDGEYRAALPHLDPFTEGEAPFHPALYQGARCRILGGFELERAVSLLARYIELDEPDLKPTRADALWRQGLAFEGLDQPDRARTCYQKALMLEPDHEQAKDALKNLD